MLFRSRILRPLGLELSHKPAPWKWSLCSKTKDGIPTKKKKGVVYEIPCGSCEEVYVGETLRTVDDRVKEHKRHTAKGEVLQSAVAEHAREKEHTIAWDSARIVDRAGGWTQRKVKEALHIACHKSRGSPLMNKDDGMKISNVWKALVGRSADG